MRELSLLRSSISILRVLLPCALHAMDRRRSRRSANKSLKWQVMANCFPSPLIRSIFSSRKICISARMSSGDYQVHGRLKSTFGTATVFLSQHLRMQSSLLGKWRKITMEGLSSLGKAKRPRTSSRRWAVSSSHGVAQVLVAAHH